VASASLFDRVFSGLGSLRLAVVTMLTLGSTCAYATFYEMSHGTEAVQRDIYKTWWFALILLTLALNIFCVMMSRYPWKAHHAGFVLAHIGILTLLAGSLISLHYGLDSNMALYEGETTDRVTLLERSLQVALPESAAHGNFPVAFEKSPPTKGHERRFVVPGTEVALVAEEFYSHAAVAESFTEGSEPNPALHFVLKAPFATQDAWLLAQEEARSHVDFGPASFGYHLAATAAEAESLLAHGPGQNHVSFVRLPDGVIRYGLTAKSGPGARGVVEVGKAIETPWMSMTLSVDQVLERATLARTVLPATPPEKDERRMPAVRVHLEGPSGRTPSEWLLWSEARSIPFGSTRATVAYRSPELQVPFKVSLVKFNSDKYPGSNRPATFESWVRVEDPERGASEHHISMNHPLHYRGYIFFQASFVEGEPMMSIFSVARAPGLPLVYLGVALIGMGVAWMFYLKPYLARRQGARALEAHRLREKSHEAEPRPDSAVPAGRATPASSGA
jgi:ResB-like family